MQTEKRLIDVGKAIHDMCQACSMAAPGIECKPKHCSLVDALRNISTVDATEVVHGRWDEIPNKYMSVSTKTGSYSGHATSCSACHEINPNVFKTNYCPNCGAKMDGEREPNVQRNEN